MIMEYGPFTKYLAKYLPIQLSSNSDFKKFLLGPSTPMLYSYADTFMYTLADRYKVYEAANFDHI